MKENGRGDWGERKKMVGVIEEHRNLGQPSPPPPHSPFAYTPLVLSARTVEAKNLITFFKGNVPWLSGIPVGMKEGGSYMLSCKMQIFLSLMVFRG